jgi:hypothetical protein
MRLTLLGFHRGFPNHLAIPDCIALIDHIASRDEMVGFSLVGMHHDYRFGCLGCERFTSQAKAAGIGALRLAGFENLMCMNVPSPGSQS